MVFGARARRPCHWSWAAGIVAIWVLVSLAQVFAVGEEACIMVYFQAHRGGLEEVPENTLVALEHAWSIRGAVPEVDLRTTRDGVVVCMHDETPARTTNAPEPWRAKRIAEIPFETLRGWDAGGWFDAKYAGTPVPTLDEVLAAMRDKPDREIYLDLKDADEQRLAECLREAGLERRVIFVHGDVAACRRLQQLYEGARTMTWLSGTPRAIKARFEELAAEDFAGLSQLQLHLYGPRRGGSPVTYFLEPEYLRDAVKRTRAAGVALQARPMIFDALSLRGLIDAGIRWFVTDAPKAFAASIQEALSLPSAPE
ncbi:MAG TPA: glycerophosphodiester phosphodiesterase family protein [Candidatus Hydrogenedentes bacterium]|nr:glycerophosphodiester phosphodiesterase family protein [Candidatus Hydrogenedentota bacterium]